MTDAELLALTAVVNDQANRMAYYTAKAQALGEEPRTDCYSDTLVIKLVNELERRRLLD